MRCVPTRDTRDRRYGIGNCACSRCKERRSVHARSHSHTHRGTRKRPTRRARRVCHTWHTFAGKRAILLETVLGRVDDPSAFHHSSPLFPVSTDTHVTCTRMYTRTRTDSVVGYVCVKSREPRPSRCLRLSDVHNDEKCVTTLIPISY